MLKSWKMPTARPVGMAVNGCQMMKSWKIPTVIPMRMPVGDPVLYRFKSWNYEKWLLLGLWGTLNS